MKIFIFLTVMGCLIVTGCGATTWTATDDSAAVEDATAPMTVALETTSF